MTWHSKVREVKRINETPGCYYFQVNMDMYKVCTGMLIILQLFLVLWFIIENTALTRCFNIILLHYVGKSQSTLYINTNIKYTRNNTHIHIYFTLSSCHKDIYVYEVEVLKSS